MTGSLQSEIESAVNLSTKGLRERLTFFCMRPSAHLPIKHLPMALERLSEICLCLMWMPGPHVRVI